MVAISSNDGQSPSAQSPIRRSSGTLFKLRDQLPWELSEFRILSVDGGGIKGILPAAILAECEKRFANGRSAGRYFDMIAGTSTGGIIALGLGSGITAAEVLRIYVDHGREIFPPKRYSSSSVLKRFQKGYDLIRATRRYRYEREPLQRHLQAVFGNRQIGDSERRLVVPSFDGYTEVTLFKTPHHPDYKLDWKEALVDVALATSAAPTFFSVFKTGGRHFADGGVWANNPVMNALVDALVCYRLDRRQIHILSLACGDQEIEFTEKQKRRGGLWHWREIISSAMHLQSQNAVGQAGLLIGRDQLLRLNVKLQPPLEMDDYERAVVELPAIAKQIVDENLDRLVPMFAEERPVYKAFHGPRVQSGDGPS